jgi:hypothetical protein
VTRRVYLHPGPLKTGTTYLQSLCYANRGAFLAQGISVVGNQHQHYRAANELMSRKSLRTTAVPEGAWERMRKAVLAAPGDVVISCERYSLFRAEHVRRVLVDLREREIHAVLTLRDLAAVLSARWQENIKNGGTSTWAEFQERITDDPARVRKATRAVSTLEVWAGALPADRIHLVTVPPPGGSRTLLLERFCEVIGVDPERLDVLEATRANPSMDLVTAELIRRVNAQREVALSGDVQHSEIKSFLARKLATPKRGRPELSAAAFESARAESEALVRRVRQGGFHVVGDLADLTSSPPSASETGSVDVDGRQLLDTAVVAIAVLAQRSGGHRVRGRKADRRGRRRTRRVWRRLRRRVRR